MAKSLKVIQIVGLISLCVLVLLGVLWIFVFKSISVKRSSSETVYVGPGQYEETFGKSMKNATAFFDPFNKALDASKAGDYQTAIKLLNEALTHAEYRPEVAMVYQKLADIYHELGDLETELKYVEELPKYTPHEEIRVKDRQRAEELRKLIAEKKFKATMQ